MKTKKLTVELHPRVYKLVQRLHATGLWGFSLEETAERLLCERLRQEMAPGLLRSAKKKP